MGLLPSPARSTRRSLPRGGGKEGEEGEGWSWGQAGSEEIGVICLG